MLKIYKISRNCQLISFLLWALTVASPAMGDEQNRNILIMGDSISAAYGINRKEGWVSLLAARLTATNPTYRIINASVSGETTGGGLARLPGALARHKPIIVVLELGANDGLRGYPIHTIEQNLHRMIALCQMAKARVLLTPMQIPPNYGKRYTQAFTDLFYRVATESQVAVSPFLLDGAAGRPELVQKDGIHPTSEAQPILLANVWKELQSLLEML